VDSTPGKNFIATLSPERLSLARKTVQPGVWEMTPMSP
jgi:hypothetical protein